MEKTYFNNYASSELRQSQRSWTVRALNNEERYREIERHLRYIRQFLQNLDKEFQNIIFILSFK